MISIIFVFLAAVCNSFMDAVENEPNYNESIFKKLDKRHWCKEFSWQNDKKIFGYHLDPWHIAKSTMIICFGIAIIYFKLPLLKWQDVALYICVYGAIWNITFWLFYHKIFSVE